MDISLEPITELAVSSYWYGRTAVHPYVQVSRSRVVFGGHSWKRLSTCDLFSLSGLDHVLVPVNAFGIVWYYMPPVRIVKQGSYGILGL